jgi:hypothetical protein
MQRYELIRLAQLVFALLLMFGAFLGGLAVGWWRWGKTDSSTGSDQRASAPRAATGGFRPQPPRPQVSSDLFTPAEPSLEPLEEPPRAVGTSFTPGPRELAPSVDPFQR